MHLLFAVILIFSVPAFGADLAVPSSACQCDQEAADILEGPNQLNFGVFTGQCVDTCRYRKSIPLPSKSLGARVLTLSNYMHEGKYWTAKIPTDGAKNAQVAFEEFMPGVFHVFLIFDFAATNPVLLRPQAPAKDTSIRKISNLVISPEGIPPKDGKYNFLDAYLERYPIGIRALSREQVISYSVENLKHEIQVFDLKLNQAQIAELLKTALDSLSTKSFRTKYDLLSNNCATSILDYVDAVVKPDVMKRPFYYQWLYPLERALPIAGPFGTRKIFTARELIAGENGRSILK